MSDQLVGLVKVQTSQFNHMFDQFKKLIDQHKQTYKTACQEFMHNNPGKYVRCFPNVFKKRYVTAEQILLDNVGFGFGVWNDVPSKLIEHGYVNKNDILFCGNFWYGYPNEVDQFAELKKLVDNSTDGYVYLSPSSLEDITLIKRYLK